MTRAQISYAYDLLVLHAPSAIYLSIEDWPRVRDKAMQLTVSEGSEFIHRLVQAKIRTEKYEAEWLEAFIDELIRRRPGRRQICVK